MTPATIPLELELTRKRVSFRSRDQPTNQAMSKHPRTRRDPKGIGHHDNDKGDLLPLHAHELMEVTKRALVGEKTKFLKRLTLKRPKNKEVMFEEVQ